MANPIDKAAGFLLKYHVLAIQEHKKRSSGADVTSVPFSFGFRFLNIRKP